MTQHFSHFTAADAAPAPIRPDRPDGLAAQAQKAMRAAGRPSALSLLTASYAAAVEGRSDGGPDPFSPRNNGG